MQTHTSWIQRLAGIVILVASLATTNFVVHPGRHVCMKQEQVQTPVKRMQSYCKPTYKKQVRMCEDGYQLCTSFRVVYELAYREVTDMQADSRMVYMCCPGWTQKAANQNSCMKPICSNDCKHGGTCANPEKCDCPAGWTGKSCDIDINECQTSTHGCQHTCVNNNGSYRCECHDGFNLEPDGKTCKMCLNCIPELKDIHHNYQTLSRRVVRLEQEKNQLRKNLTRMERDYRNRIQTLQNDIQAAASPPDKPPEENKPENDYHPLNQASLDRLQSLSDQISILEERMEMCDCNREGVPGL